jgi:hypothetical protein
MSRETYYLYNGDIDETETSMRNSVSSDPSRDSTRWKNRHIPKIILNLSDKLLGLKARESLLNKSSYQLALVDIMKLLHLLFQLSRNSDTNNVRHVIS